MLLGIICIICLGLILYHIVHSINNSKLNKIAYSILWTIIIVLLYFTISIPLLTFCSDMHYYTYSIDEYNDVLLKYKNYDELNINKIDTEEEENITVTIVNSNPNFWIISFVNNKFIFIDINEHD